MRGYGFLRVGGPEQQAFVDVPEPVAGPGELLVRVRAAGVNPGDRRVRDGSYGVDGPAVLGREVAGTVLATGEGVTGFAAGDEVFGGCPGMLGGWAPAALVTASFSAHRPDGVSPEQAAVLPVAAGTELGGNEVLRDRSTAVLTELARLVATGELDPLVTEVRPLDQAGEALALVESGHATGKVVLVP